MDEKDRARLAADMRWAIEQAEYVLRILSLPYRDTENEDNIMREVARLRLRAQGALNDVVAALVASRQGA